MEKKNEILKTIEHFNKERIATQLLSDLHRIGARWLTANRRDIIAYGMKPDIIDQRGDMVVWRPQRGDLVVYLPRGNVLEDVAWLPHLSFIQDLIEEQGWELPE